jgi:Helicase associated domain
LKIGQMNPLQETETTQRQDDHPQQSQQQCGNKNNNNSNPEDDDDYNNNNTKTTIPSSHQPSDINSKMISVEDHEGILKRIQEEHEATVKRLQLEIERLKDYDTVINTKEEPDDDIKESKRELQQEDINEGLSRPEQLYGNRKRTKIEPSSNKLDAKWQARYDELKQFQETHGHCNVPTTDEAYKELSKW